MIALVTKVTSFVTRRRKSQEDEDDNIVNTNGHSDDRRLSKPGSFLTSINTTYHPLKLNRLSQANYA